MNFVAMGIVRGAGDTHLSMITGLLVNGIHLTLAIMLIFGYFFFPELGVRGSALAAGIGHMIGCILTYTVILRGKSVLSFKWSDFTNFNWKSNSEIIKTGIPITLEQLAWITGMTIVIGFSNRLGPIAAAAQIIILTYQRLFSVLYNAFGIGALTLVGQRYGANEHESAKETSRTFFWFAAVVVLFLSGVIFFRSRHLALVFTSNAEVLELCGTVFKIVAIVQLPKVFSFVFSFSLRGVGENKYPMYLAFVGVFFFEVMLGYTLAFVFSLSLVGLWLAAFGDETFKVLMARRRFHKRIADLKRLKASEQK
jgi:putative MATE family efflux protein